MGLQRQTAEWYDRLATIQEGYFYPCRSQVGTWNGEDEYLVLVRQHLRPDADVLDVACGHGAVTLDIAPLCRSVLGYDRTAAWIALAQQAAQERKLTNVTFVCRDSSAAANSGQVRLPAQDDMFDLLICSKGPFHWIEDARRVARPGAVLLMLVPDATPVTAWRDWLPESIRWQEATNPHWARPAIEQRLATVGLAVHSWWSFDVPEVFPDPKQLYTWLTWGYTPDEVPALAEVYPLAELVAGRQRLAEKVEKYQPKVVAILGITAYRTGFGQPRATMGQQPEMIHQSLLWVLPNPSGLNAHYTPAALAEVYRDFRLAIEQ